MAPTIGTFAHTELPPNWQGTAIFDADAIATIKRLLNPLPSPAPSTEDREASTSEGPADAAYDGGPVVTPETLARVAVAEQEFEGHYIQTIRKEGCKYIEANEGNPRGLP